MCQFPESKYYSKGHEKTPKIFFARKWFLFVTNLVYKLRYLYMVSWISTAIFTTKRNSQRFSRIQQNRIYPNLWDMVLKNRILQIWTLSYQRSDINNVHFIKMCYIPENNWCWKESYKPAESVSHRKITWIRLNSYMRIKF